MLPYKSSSHSAKCVRCASLQSGGRRLAVRTAMEHHIGVLSRTPFPASRDFPSRGNEKMGGTGYCVTYDTDSQSRNAPCVPFRGRGPRSGEGVDGGKNDYGILILCLIALKGKRLTTFCASLRSRGRRLAVRTVMEHPIGTLPRTPFPASRDFPSRGNEKICGTGYCVTYDTESQSRNADFISIAQRAIRNPRGQWPRQT